MEYARRSKEREMALEIHMKIEDVTGDSKGFHFKGWCDVESMQWGMTSNREKVLDAEGATTSFNELSIEKPLGIDSASIRMLFAKGAVIPTVDLKVMPVATKREVQTKYLDIRLEDVLIRSGFKEHISLLFDRIKFEYSLDPFRPTGEELPPAIEFSWNVSSNDEWTS
jgi:type VI protein secretion system component Hcp